MTSTNATNRKSKRDDPKRSSTSVTIVAVNDQQNTKIKTAVKPADAVLFSQATAAIHHKKRRATEIIQNEVPLAERLSAFESQSSVNGTNADTTQANLSADTQVTLLTQGLRSSDNKLLDNL